MSTTHKIPADEQFFCPPSAHIISDGSLLPPKEIVATTKPKQNQVEKNICKAKLGYQEPFVPEKNLGKTKKWGTITYRLIQFTNKFRSMEAPDGSRDALIAPAPSAKEQTVFPKNIHRQRHSTDDLSRYKGSHRTKIFLEEVETSAKNRLDILAEEHPELKKLIEDGGEPTPDQIALVAGASEIIDIE